MCLLTLINLLWPLLKLRVEKLWLVSSMYWICWAKYQRLGSCLSTWPLMTTVLCWLNGMEIDQQIMDIKAPTSAALWAPFLSLTQFEYHVLLLPQLRTNIILSNNLYILSLDRNVFHFLSPLLPFMWHVSLSKFVGMWVRVYKYVLWYSELGCLTAPLVYIL